MTEQQAPERIGLISDGMGNWALAHASEADQAIHYTRADLTTPATECPFGDDCDLTVAYMAGAASKPDDQSATIARLTAERDAALATGFAQGIEAALYLPRYSPASTGNNQAHMVEDEAGQYVCRKDIRAVMKEQDQ